MPLPPALTQLLWLFVLSGVVACVAWTVTHEQVLEEPRIWCERQSQNRARPWWVRKFFYLFTCEYCFSHYVTLLFLILTRYHLWLDDWRGYIIAFFSLVFIANVYMSAFGELRLEIREDRQDIATKEELAARRQKAGGVPTAH